MAAFRRSSAGQSKEAIAPSPLVGMKAINAMIAVRIDHLQQEVKDARKSHLNQITHEGCQVSA